MIQAAKKKPIAKKKVVTKKKPSAQPKLTNVVIVLDSSGSMDAMRREAVDVFNAQVKTLQDPANANLGYRISLVTFSTEVHEPKLWNKDVADLKPLTVDDYQPDGQTALLDAIATTVERMEKLPQPSGHNIANLVVIITDGQENNSKTFNWSKVKDIIEARQARKNWTFSFMGANMNVVEVACGYLGIQKGNVACFQATAQGLKKAGVQTQGALRSYSNARHRGADEVQTFYAGSDS